MRRLTYINSRGESIIFYRSPFLITLLEGIGEVASDVQTQKAPYQDGSQYIDNILQQRPIALEGAIDDMDLQAIQAHRSDILRVCNPKLGEGTIRLEKDGLTREITGTVEGVPAFPEKGSDPIQKFAINFLCPNPCWRDFQQMSTVLQAYRGNFTLPFTLPFELGFAGDRTELINKGDVPAPINIDIHGPVSNPQIINRTTGEYMKINRVVAENEILHIDTTPGKKRVEIFRNGNELINAFGNMDFTGGSTMWELDIGLNEIEHIADAGNADALVVVTWHNLYAGI